MSAGYDLVIFQGIEVRGDTPVALGFGTSGLACRGVQKASQTFTTLFLTDQGSDPRDATRGTTFMKRLRSGQIRSDEALQAAFRFAVMDIKNYLSATKAQETMPDDEAIAEATLTRWQFDYDTLRIWVKVTTRAGTSRVYALPIASVEGLE